MHTWRNLYLAKEHLPLFHRLQTSSGKPDIVEQKDAKPWIAVWAAVWDGVGSAMAMSQMSVSRLCHSKLGFSGCGLSKDLVITGPCLPFDPPGKPSDDRHVSCQSKGSLGLQIDSHSHVG